jgi:multidrug efflux system membrane fusion protein
VIATASESLAGHVEYIAAVADDQTHTFECDISIQNPGYKIPSGMSATIKIMGSNPEPMHKLPPVALSLDQEERVGVKTVENNVVNFYPVQALESNATEIWVKGLPEQASIIVTGHEFVKTGETVTAVEQATEG